MIKHENIIIIITTTVFQL